MAVQPEIIAHRRPISHAAARRSLNRTLPRERALLHRRLTMTKKARVDIAIMAQRRLDVHSGHMPVAALMLRDSA